MEHLRPRRSSHGLEGFAGAPQQRPQEPAGQGSPSAASPRPAAPTAPGPQRSAHRPGLCPPPPRFASLSFPLPLLSASASFLSFPFLSFPCFPFPFPTRPPSPGPVPPPQVPPARPGPALTEHQLEVVPHVISGLSASVLGGHRCLPGEQAGKAAGRGQEAGGGGAGARRSRAGAAASAGPRAPSSPPGSHPPCSPQGLPVLPGGLGVPGNSDSSLLTGHGRPRWHLRRVPKALHGRAVGMGERLGVSKTRRGLNLMGKWLDKKLNTI